MEPTVSTPPSYPTLKLTLLERHEEYDGVYAYVFRPERPIAFTAGQYGHVRVLSLPEDMRRVREFSFASSPQDAEVWFGIDSRSGSDYQRALLALNPGEHVELFKIKSHLTWPPTGADVVMIAGGIGATPFRSMLRDKQDRNIPMTTTLIHCANGPYLYGEELNGLAQTYTQVSRPALAGTLASVAKDHANAHYYVAGSAGFTDTVVAELNKSGVTNIESDVFKGLADSD